MKCPKCGLMADPFATKCPHCGPLDDAKSGKKSASLKPMAAPALADMDGEVVAAPAKPPKRALLPGPAKGEKSAKPEKPVDTGASPSKGTNFLSNLLDKLKPKAKALPPAGNTEEDFSIDEPG